MTRNSFPPLRPRATDLAEFANDMAALGPMTARSLAVQYLDQELAEDYNGSFDDAVEAFIPFCRYYA